MTPPGKIQFQWMKDTSITWILSNYVPSKFDHDIDSSSDDSVATDHDIASGSKPISPTTCRSIVIDEDLCCLTG